MGKKVSVFENGKYVFDAMVNDIEQDFRLAVIKENGEKILLNSGEVSVIIS